MPTFAVVHGGERVTPAGSQGGFHGTVNVILDGQTIRGAISRIIADEQRSYAGPSYAGSPF
jgi:hypothetical protein